MNILCEEGIFMRKGEEDQGTVLLRYGKAILLGGGVGFLSCLLFMLLASVGVSKGLIGGELRYQLTVVGCVLGGLIGGIFAVRGCRGRGLFVGLAVGGVFFLLQLTLGLLIYKDISMESGGVGLLCGALCGGAAAGILSGGGRKTSRSKKRRRG